MKLRTCEFCGTEYDENLQQCPLCGKSGAVAGAAGAAEAAPAEKPKRRLASSGGGARVAPKGSKAKEEKAPQGVWTISCVVLGAAVLIGLVYFLYIMGVFGN